MAACRRAVSVVSLIGKLEDVIDHVLTKTSVAVEVEFLRCRREKSFLRPTWEDGVLWQTLLMM